MTAFISIALLVLSSVATLAAFGGDTWTKGPEPLVKRINIRGWISLICLFLSLVLGVFQILRTQKLEAQRAADEPRLFQDVLEKDRLKHAPGYISPDLKEWIALDDANKAADAGHYEEAVAKIDEAISQMNKGGNILPGVREKAYISRARFNLELRHYQDVINDCDELANDKLDADAQGFRYLFKGKALALLDRSQEAIENFTACIKIHPDFQECYEGVAYANFSSKNYQRALDAANEGLDRQGDDKLLLQIRDAALLGLDIAKKTSSLNPSNGGSPPTH